MLISPGTSDIIASVSYCNWRFLAPFHSDRDGNASTNGFTGAGTMAFTKHSQRLIAVTMIFIISILISLSLAGLRGDQWLNQDAPNAAPFFLFHQLGDTLEYRPVFSGVDTVRQTVSQYQKAFLNQKYIQFLSKHLTAFIKQLNVCFGELVKSSFLTLLIVFDILICWMQNDDGKKRLLFVK